MDAEVLRSRKAEVESLFANAQIIAEMSSADRDKLFNLVLDPGFPILVGLLLGERQGTLMQLSYAKAGDPAQLQQLGVLQGTIRGIERVYAILLESTQVPTETQG